MPRVAHAHRESLGEERAVAVSEHSIKGRPHVTIRLAKGRRKPSCFMP